jgi:hypothetical protein
MELVENKNKCSRHNHRGGYTLKEAKKIVYSALIPKGIHLEFEHALYIGIKPEEKGEEQHEGNSQKTG